MVCNASSLYDRAGIAVIYDNHDDNSLNGISRGIGGEISASIGCSGSSTFWTVFNSAAAATDDVP
jgi:hypothetical protein